MKFSKIVSKVNHLKGMIEEKEKTMGKVSISLSGV